MRRNLWLASAFKPIGMSGRLTDPGARLLLGILVLSFAAGLAALVFSPLRFKWICVPVYVVLMPLAMGAIDIAINGLHIE
jgi:hypothetical protein